MLAPSAARRALLRAPVAARCLGLLDTIATASKSTPTATAAAAAARLLVGPRRHKSTQQQRAPQQPKPKGAWVPNGGGMTAPAAPSRQQVPVHRTPTPYLHLQDRPYLLQPIDLAKPMAVDSKIVYEVTLEVDEDIVPAYLDWIRRGHIQEVMALPGFLGWKMAQADGDTPAQTQGLEGQRRVVFVETYELKDRAALQTYFDEYAQPVRDDHTRMWDGKFAARRRILHVFGTQSEQEAQLWKTREARNAFRLRNLEHQRSQMPTWTETGLKTAKLPAPLWEKLRGFYQANKGKAVEDRLDPNEISINTWAAPTFRLDLPKELADEVVQTMKSLLEEWTGIEELEPTGISGIRTYLPGATIQEHVDMATTNVISALINIDQDVTEDWPLEMKDLGGKVHPLNLQPGEFVMYESAVCAHARSRPLQGSHYTNCFLRFRPAGWTFSYDE